MNTKSLIISIFLGVLVFVIGGALGILYQMQAPKVQSQNTLTLTPQPSATIPQVVKDLNSQVITSIGAYGIVTKIDGRNITLSNQSDSIIIAVRDDAKIYSFVTMNGKPTSQQIDFKDIKNGDNVSISVKVSLDGQIEGYSLIVSPPVLSSPAK